MSLQSSYSISWISFCSSLLCFVLLCFALLYTQPVSEETEASVKDALLTASKVLEQARCLESEREANILMASSLLSNENSSTVDVSTLPGGVQDAWSVLATKPDGDPASLPIHQGQLGQAMQTATLSGSLHRSAEIRSALIKRRVKDGQTLQDAIKTAKEVHESVWLKVFDERLREVRAYHARHETPNKKQRYGNPVYDGYDLASSVTQHVENLETAFSADEVMGKYLDLQTVYEQTVIPMKHVLVNDEDRSFRYGDFVAMLYKGLTIPEERKLKDRKKYVRLLAALEKYLEGFLKRTQPLLPIKDVTGPAIEEFENDWRETGGADGWEAKPAEKSMVDSNNDDAAKLDLSPYSSADDLEKAIDGDTLKAELAKLGLKCGGTVSDRAKRLFMTKGTPLDQLPKKLFAKKKTESGSSTSKNERRVDIARREVVVVALLNQLRPILEASVRRTERRETQTLKEREKEMEEDLHGSAVTGPKTKGENEEGSDDDDDDDEDAPIYNPKGVPLGWDGKPIPYWLFKLHGLNHFYPCEICGNESYRGRRNFETHFAEAKHAFGMKSLGIPNTKHFHGVTKIEDAQKLWKTLKGQLQQQQFDGSKEEEYEDSHGNVLSRATYEDLARQGLL